MLTNKNILLGVCGSIASYKSAHLIRLLVKAGANVKVIMTADATQFITPLTLATLSKNPVLTAYYNPESGEWHSHVELGLWADLILIAPASANTIAKMASGICDNLLLAAYLSAKNTVYFAPAMDLDMWHHPATQQNIAKLQSYGNILIKPAYGELASGLTGEGRMAEPEDIISFLTGELKKKLPLTGKKALVTAGPTYEAIDPVRFIGNHSSGKMGYAIAERLEQLGADVTLISGPTSLRSSANIKKIAVTSADEMLIAATDNFGDADITVMSAAVADYKPDTVAPQKIKKDSGSLNIALTKTTDILAQLGKRKKPGQLLIGFALETEHEEANAIAKIKKKNLDFIVLNSLNDKNAGFKGDYNKVTIIDRQLNKEYFELKSKVEVADDICKKIVALMAHD
ncbi:bifunctional phosphopantothenoylcysteine decarboxylase/phosphopantothenate--cysteine ligase CoaBC [Pedobacter sp. BS3]|uniref:bifunctional phosphopantothenoylcysteine decarboxylase/phosphopantothenate--cysteine ligase CoaBC n=1 Tax=Pedobacter sp. BS3 TaxID=2567937 RepID=UPI0011ED47E2|nr:bifunctional phosphopantothenoylcysteine decarboxylase/phosphopantothenate--cysteine ligase CoaBC [Pedobacter sp. BS3]TZF81900.1 bifunctional phosphopantothenoylcysteine decarboxylase/phosphopantothenate--cysteine ligase CoaBC [Pedobacter sp. BS3]